MKSFTTKNLFLFVTISLISFLFTGCATHYDSTFYPPLKFQRELDSISSESTTTSRPGIYTVKKGDTIWKISYEHGVSPDRIIKYNNIKNVENIKPGQQIFIPTGFTGTRKTPSRTILTSSRKTNETFIWPLRGKTLSRFDQWKNGEKNTGIDIQAYGGQTVRASKGGIVALTSDTPDGWGKVVILQHYDGSYTWYAYNSEILVKKGDEITQGHIIAKAGATGSAKQSKLHFKVFVHGMPVNPLYYLPKI